MTRIRLTLADEEGCEIHSAQEHVDNLPGGAHRLVDIEAAVEHFRQEALPELEAELLRRAQRQFVAEGKKGAS